MQTVGPVDRIIWSADVKDKADLMAALDLMPELRNVKIDCLFLTGTDLTVIDRLNERGLKVFDDAKINEIPSKLEAIARKHLERKPWMLNCMAGCVSSMVSYDKDQDRDKIDGLKRFADACYEVDTRSCGVTVLTSKTPEIVKREFGRTSEDQVLEYVAMLLVCGFTDVVCSPKEVPIIRAESRFDVLDLNTPGIRPAGADQGDQARSDTPQGALAAGTDRLIIGRPITNGNPAENLRNIIASISMAAGPAGFRDCFTTHEARKEVEQ